jgi:hypothetical protein
MDTCGDVRNRFELIFTIKSAILLYCFDKKYDRNRLSKKKRKKENHFHNARLMVTLNN